MDVKDFIGNWKKELRAKAKRLSGVQAISILEIGESQEILLGKCREVGIIGFVYRIPEDSGINTEELKMLLREAESETGTAFLELPVPEFIDIREIDDKYYVLPVGEGVVTFLNSQKEVGDVVEILVKEGYGMEINGELQMDDIKELGYCRLLEKVLDREAEGK